MLRRSFFFKQRGGTTFNPSYSMPEVHRSVKYEPDYYQRTPAKDAKKIDGIITKWHFIERCGEIEVLDANDRNKFIKLEMPKVSKQSCQLLIVNLKEPKFLLLQF